MDVLPVEEPGIDGPVARSHHRQGGAQNRQHDSDSLDPREYKKASTVQRVLNPGMGVHKPTRRRVPHRAAMICRAERSESATFAIAVGTPGRRLPSERKDRLRVFPNASVALLEPEVESELNGVGASWGQRVRVAD